MATKVAAPVDVGLAAFTGYTPATMPVSAPVAAAITAAVEGIDPGAGSDATPVPFTTAIDFRSNKTMPQTGFYVQTGPIAFDTTDIAGAINDTDTTALIQANGSPITAPGVLDGGTLASIVGGQQVLVNIAYVSGVKIGTVRTLTSNTGTPIPLTISGTPVTAATSGTPYAGFTATAAGGTTPYTFTLVNAPSGMVVSSGGAVTYPSPLQGSYTGIIVRVTDSLGAVASLTAFNLAVAAAGSAPAYKVGFYTNDPAPPGNQNNTFLSNEDEWMRIMGVKPQTMNVFVDFTQTTANWAGDIYYKMQYLNATTSAYVGAGGGFIPEIGLAMCSNDMGHDEWLDALNAGTFDQYISDIAKNAGTAGYPIVHFRPGYEFNGGFMKWSPANSGRSTRNADFVNAFKRIYTLIHASASANGFTARVIWNPTAINFNSGNLIIEDLYPGDAYVDVIGLDIYGKMYPRDLTDWRDGTTQMSSFAAWSAVPANINHYLSWNDATQANPHGDGAGCSSERLAAFALAHGKPFSFPECGCGNNDASVGPIDNYQFPIFLKDFVQRWQSQGLTFINMNIWSTDQVDGGWGFLYGQRPLAAAQWASLFGAGPVADDGNLKALKYRGNTDTGNTAYMPDAPNLRATNQVVRLTSRGRIPTPPSGSSMAFMSKWNDGSSWDDKSNKEWFWARGDTGAMVVVWMTASGAAIASSIVDNIAANAAYSRRVEFNPVTGLVKFYTSADGVTFSQLGSDVTASAAGAIPTPSNASGVELGQVGSGTRPYIGTITSATIEIGGTLVFDAHVTIAGIKDNVTNFTLPRNGAVVVNDATQLPQPVASGGTTPVPGQVTALATTAQTDTSFSLSWSAPSSGGTPTDYLVEYKLASASTWSTFAHAASTATSITVTGLPSTNPGVAYNARVSGVNTGGTGTPSSAISVTLASTSTPVPVNSVAPAISGTAQVGQTLTVSNGTWSNTPTSYTYQWKRAGTNISGATAQTYVPVTADVGNTLTCAVTASNAGGAGTAVTSAATAAVIAAASSGFNDDFNRSVSNTTVGNGWTTDANSTWGINGSGQAYVVSASDNDSTLTRDVGATNGTVAADIRLPDTLLTGFFGVGLIIRYIDATHMTWVVLNADGVFVLTRNGGGASVATSYTPALTAGTIYRVSAALTNAGYTISLNGTALGAAVADTVNNASTKAGLHGYVSTPTAAFDNFSYAP